MERRIDSSTNMMEWIKKVMEKSGKLVIIYIELTILLLWRYNWWSKKACEMVWAFIKIADKYYIQFGEVSWEVDHTHPVFAELDKKRSNIVIQ